MMWFLLLSISFSTALHADDWRFLYKEDGIDVFSDDRATPTFKAEGELNVGMIDILALFSDIPRRAEWADHLLESKALFDNRESRAVVYSLYNMPWPASNRDSVIESNFVKDYERGELTVNFKAIEDPAMPVKKGIIRIPLAEGILFLRIVEKEKTFVSYQVKLNPGGWLPQWICNYFIRDAPIHMLLSMKKRIAETRDLYKEYREAEEKKWLKTGEILR